MRKFGHFKISIIQIFYFNTHSKLIYYQTDVRFPDEDEVFKEVRMVKCISVKNKNKNKKQPPDLDWNTTTGFMTIWFNLNVFMRLFRK